MAATCKTCRWWEEMLHEGEGTGAGLCPHVMNGVEANQWAMAIMPGVNSSPITTGHGYWCMHHKLKESSE